MPKYSGYDAQLGVDDGAGGYTTVAQVRDISGPGLGTDTIETSDRDGSGWKEFLGGLADGGEVTFDVLYDPTGATHNATTGLVGMLASKAVKSWQLALPGSVNWTFDGLVTGFDPKAPLNDALTADVTIKVSGQPTLA